jgi:ribosome-associated protein
MESERLVDLVTQALEDMKGQQIRVLDVRGKTPLADYMVIASGTSNRHVKSLADTVVVKAKDSGVGVLGVEGQEGQEWVLVDLNDVIVHVMLPKVRDFYNLEKLWLAEEGDGGVTAAPGSDSVPGPDLVRRMRR